MVNPFYKSQVLDNPKYGPTVCKSERCTHPHKAHHVNQDCIELICEDCDKEIDFMCIGDIADDPASLNIIYEIIKNKVHYLEGALGLNLEPSTKCLLDLKMKYLELLREYKELKNKEVKNVTAKNTRPTVG